MFARPDLLYDRSFGDVLRPIRGKELAIPNWQHWDDGWNDRFAIAHTRKAADAWALRIHAIEAYGRAKGELRAERLVRFALAEAGLRKNTAFIPHRGVRIRADGRQANEDFRHFLACVPRNVFNRHKKVVLDAFKRRIGIERMRDLVPVSWRR